MEENVIPNIPFMLQNVKAQSTVHWSEFSETELQV